MRVSKTSAKKLLAAQPAMQPLEFVRALAHGLRDQLGRLLASKPAIGLTLRREIPRMDGEELHLARHAEHLQRRRIGRGETPVRRREGHDGLA
jgi:hypothetical protein